MIRIERGGLTRVFVSTLAVLCFIGCPLTASSVVGTWTMVVDPQCDEIDTKELELTLSGIEGAFLETTTSGAWDLDGTVIDFAFEYDLDSDWIFRGVVNGDTMAGTYVRIEPIPNAVPSDLIQREVVEEGCWTATRAD